MDKEVTEAEAIGWDYDIVDFEDADCKCPYCGFEDCDHLCSSS